MTSDPRRLLNVVLAVGLSDFVLLLALLYVAWIDRNDDAVSVLGPIHGLGFLTLLYLTFRGALERMWGWWFPAIVLVTGGPVGSLVGELVLRRRLRPADDLAG
jgi:integral membrane protein